MRVQQVDAGGLHLALIRFDGAAVLVDQRTLRVELLLGDRVLLDQPLVALRSSFASAEQRLVAPQIALHLLRGRFVGARIDLRERIALFHGLAFGEEDFLHDAADLCPDGHGGERRDRAQGGNAQLNAAGRGRGDRNGDRGVLPAAPPGRRRVGLLMPQISEERNHQSYDDDCDQKGNPMPAHEGYGTARWRGGFWIYRFV